MTKVLVLYYSAYGHIEAMASAVAEGAREAGATVDIKRVPELVPTDIAEASYYKLDQVAPIAKTDELANYDAIIVGTGTRFGRMASQMANFLDQSRRAVGQWRTTRQSRRRVHLHCQPAWRPRDHAVLHYHQSAAFRDDRCRPELRLFRPDEVGRDHRRFTVRRHDHHRQRWQPPADGMNLLAHDIKDE